MKCPVYEMSCLWNVHLWNVLAVSEILTNEMSNLCLICSFSLLYLVLWFSPEVIKQCYIYLIFHLLNWTTFLKMSWSLHIYLFYIILLSWKYFIYRLILLSWKYFIYRLIVVSWKYFLYCLILLSWKYFIHRLIVLFWK